MLLSDYAIKWWFVIPPTLASVSALPGETGTQKFGLFSNAVYTENNTDLACYIFIATVNAFHIFAVSKHRDFKFGIHVDRTSLQTTKSPWKGRGLVHVTHFCMRNCGHRKILPRHAVDWDQRCSRLTDLCLSHLGRSTLVLLYTMA